MKSLRITDAEEHITPRAVAESATSLVPAGAVLVVARSGILKHTLPVAVAERDVAINQDIKGCLPNTARIDSYFFAYWVQGNQPPLLTLWRQQGATVESLDVEKVKTASLPLPPLAEQRAIADFLDRETAKIDTLVAKKRTLIERLKEKRTALISRTVTRGLPPDAARAARLDPHPKLKPSGIDWLGAVPEHWRITRLSRVVACLDGRRIPLNREERSERQGPYPYWGANGIVDSVDEWLFDEPLVLLGEDGAPFFALNKEVAFFVTGKIWVNNHAHVLRPFAGIDGEFLAHALNHTEYGAFIDGSTRDKLTQDDMNAIPIATPPHAEQRAIARFLDRETAKIDTMIATVETAIERLQEYRTALITAAVTGKIDVRALSGADAAGTMTP
jgi:type I restriction enzyme S subunit